MSKICLIDNMASHYRKEIYLRMDEEFDIDWYFGEPIGDIKELDLSLLKNASHLKSVKGVLPGTYKLQGMSKLIDKYDAVIMIGEPALLSTWSLLLRHRLLKPKHQVYFWTHGWYGKESKLKAMVKKIYFKLGTGVITYGDYARNLMIKEGFNPDKLWAIHNSLAYSEQLALRNSIKPTDIYKSHFGNDAKTIIFIGRLTPVKKLDQVIDALGILSARGERYNLVFVGDGKERQALEGAAAKNNIQDRVWFYGACYDEKANAELIYNADLCVAPGNIGLTAMHSLMFGTPAATHNNFPYQMPEFEAIKEGKTGFFFKQDDVSSIADGISKWFKTHVNDREEIRSNCYKEIDENWNPDYQISVLKNVLNS